MRISVSIFGPKAFSIVSAISPDRSALPFKRLDRAGRETHRTLAAAVTDRPSGSMISLLINSPGCGGLNADMISFTLDLGTILKIHITDVAFGNVDPESHSPVSDNVKAPCAFPATSQQVRFPHRYRAKFARLSH